MSLTLEIVTPEKRVYENTVTSVVLPTREGEIGVLAGHIPLISILEPGEIKVEREGAPVEYLAVDKGYVQVIADKVSVLTEAAIDVELIDTAALADARKRAEAALAEAKDRPSIVDSGELNQLEAQMRFILTQELATKRRRN